MESERGLQRSGCQCKRPCEINVSQPGEINNWLTRSNKPSVSKQPNTGNRPFVGDLLRLANHAAPHPCKDCPFNLTRRFKTSWTERSLPLLFPCQMRCSVVWQDPSHKAMSTSRRRTFWFTCKCEHDQPIFWTSIDSACLEWHDHVNHVTRYCWLMRARVRRLILRSVLAISISQIINLEVIWAGQQWIGAQTLAMTLVFGLGISALLGDRFVAWFGDQWSWWIQGSNGKKTAKDEEDEKMNAAHYAEGTDFTKTTEKKLWRILNTYIWTQNTNKTSL